MALALSPPRRDEPVVGRVIERLHRWLLELAAAPGDAKGIGIPLRHDVMTVAQHAIERPQPRDQLRTGARRGGGVDQRVDRRVLDTDQVARAIRVRRLRAEAIDQLGAGGLVAWHANSEEIVVEHTEPLLDEREVRTPILALDAELGERLEPGRDN